MSGPSTAIAADRLLTCDPARAQPGNPLGAIDDALLVVADGVVVAVGPRADLARRLPAAGKEVRHAGLVTPGLVDAHTHAAWMGSRAGEYSLRMGGADYEQIAAAGGGIVASVDAVRAASCDEIASALSERLERMAVMGVTTVEIKSGYGLDEATERRQLEAIAVVARRGDLPSVVPTFLGLHALPPEAGGDRLAYARACCRWLEAFAGDGLARYADAYVDRAAFSVEHARLVLVRAVELGLGVRIHAGQFADVGGAELAAQLGAATADHLEHLGPAGAEALAGAGVRAVMLPVASYTLRQAPPPIELLRRAGVELIVASDANPGTAPTESLPLALALAVRSYRLTVAEVLLGATRVAAASLRSAAGVLCEGAPADVVLWRVAEEQALVQPWGVPLTAAVLRAGRLIAGTLPPAPE